MKGSHIEKYYKTRTEAERALKKLKANLPTRFRNYNLKVGKIRDEYAVFYTFAR